MDVFDLRSKMIADYADYIRSFVKIKESRMKQSVDSFLDEGNLWPEALIQLNPAFESGGYVDDLVRDGILHPECSKIFRIGKAGDNPGSPMQLHRHQADAIRASARDENYVLTTGTGSGKSIAYVIPIVNHVLKTGAGKGIKAIIVYPMNALANSQEKELQKFVYEGYQEGKAPVTFKKYTGQENQQERDEIRNHPPDILLTNYMMLELILTRDGDQKIIDNSSSLKYLVLDELHTYRGRQGADVAMMVRRLSAKTGKDNIRCIGTSATLASEGDFELQRQEVARVASLLFGKEVKPEFVIYETLRRATDFYDFNEPQNEEHLRNRLNTYNPSEIIDYDTLCKDPLYSWIENTFGVIKDAQGRLVRQKPISVNGPASAARNLSEHIGLLESRCASIIQGALLNGYKCMNPLINRPALAFRVHQFISRGDTVYSTLETEDSRYIAFTKQQYAPGSDNKLLLPVCFCRECGQDYYSVNWFANKSEYGRHIEGREPYSSRNEESDDAQPGFLYINSADPWPQDAHEAETRLPDEWLEELPDGSSRVRKDRKDLVPLPIRLSSEGVCDDSDGTEFLFTPAPFVFCPNCGVSYKRGKSSDVARVATLDIAGRSSATTILSLSAIRNIKNTNLPYEAQKLLSFTDNRQDASLQAGHFNDFVEVGILRAAIYRAVSNSGQEGISHHQLAQEVFKALNLTVQEYAVNPEVRFAAKENTDSALREVLGYRIYSDLKRGWRVSSPNLEQCGLLKIEYASLDDLCSAEDIWAQKHEAMRTAKPSTRRAVLSALLDYMRRELSIKVDYLRQDYQEQIIQRSNQHLIEPWAIEQGSKNAMEKASITFPQTKPKGEKGNHTFLSEYSGFAQYLTRSTTFPDYSFTHKRSEAIELIRHMLDALTIAGLVEVVDSNSFNQPGYQVVAAAMIWKAGDGTAPYHDPIRIPQQSRAARGGNDYFINYYRDYAFANAGIKAREHTAQVPNELRKQREEKFTAATLPILYCSPTMELGVDIAQLNMVNMRNIPPTPANYAQRSGRAGRQGQPALVFSYCTLGSPHDQYYFRHPQLMVAGSVSPPRMDLTNEDLVRSHVHSMWLTTSRMSLGASLKDVLTLDGEPPSLAVKDSKQSDLQNDAYRKQARQYAGTVLGTIEGALEEAGWYSDGWLDQVLQAISMSFDDACTRWRTLYMAAYQQSKLQSSIILDHTRNEEDRRLAKKLRAEAERQLDLLQDSNSQFLDDFYSYRYFASEGFLPGYNFPRLPLSAYISGRRETNKQDEYISRPRFLAVSEFGPRSIIYHEGSRYQVNRVILPVDREGEKSIPTSSAKLCPACGYLHIVQDGVGIDCCERCSKPLESIINDLFRMQNVSTRRRDKITSDEEERSRQGYELKTVIRFAERAGESKYSTAQLDNQDGQLAQLSYGNSATIWRINVGRKRRKDKDHWGFNLDVERGYWVPEKEEIEDDPDNQDPLSPLKKLAIPFVEDRRNCLLLEPVQPLDMASMASLQAAMRKAIQIKYQLEENEIAVEPLPSSSERKLLLFYEAAEGGAGVLKRLIESPLEMPDLARIALELCHYDPVTGGDMPKNSGSECVVACYDCLMSYGNQMDHLLLNRESIKPVLLDMIRSRVSCSPTERSREEQYKYLVDKTDSSLERQWLELVYKQGCRLPSESQRLIEQCQTRPDFLYSGAHNVVIYVDGPPHDFPDRQERDQAQQDLLEDYGYVVLRFHHQDNWISIIEQHPELFGLRNRLA